ncbi:hypothetical protein [Comamonas sp. JC664]|uniref:hypothetical protein n=1 Tax=Comamonas sp. JC664 TaxID=2801917 RepID=UPI00174B10DC|nr:hypothetical protein [Comamonas sp. JC664]MBL0698205.1 hypothetical protein [Comamonas sp. JC664]GHG88955.1 3-oxoacyl-ACP synthase [Comamonas sp. KCTC 72670]
MSLAITGLGMVSSVGYDVVSSCAAIRCRMALPVPLGLQVVASGDQPGVESVVGFPIQGLTEGFVGLGLHALLVQEAIQDLCGYSRLTGEGPLFWENTALFLGISGARTLEQELLAEQLQESLLPVVVRRSGLGFSQGLQKVIAGGHVSVLAAMAEAADAIATGHVQRALIVGVDSLTSDLAALEWLDLKGRLKTPERAVGFMPGEAAVAVLVEDPVMARRCGARMEAYVEALQVGGSGRAVPSMRLVEPLEGTLARATRIGDVYGDLNGDASRASEWGTFLARFPPDSVLAGAQGHWPAMSLGDTGAASGGVSIAVATRSFVRKYAREDEILVWSRSDEGEVASGLLVRR